MQIEVNGQPAECSEQITLARLLEDMGYGDQRVAVEHNRQIVPSEQHADTRIASGDTLEIVHAIGGGQAVSERDTFTVAGRAFNARYWSAPANTPI